MAGAFQSTGFQFTGFQEASLATHWGGLLLDLQTSGWTIAVSLTETAAAADAPDAAAVFANSLTEAVSATDSTDAAAPDTLEADGGQAPVQPGTILLSGASFSRKRYREIMAALRGAETIVRRKVKGVAPEARAAALEEINQYKRVVRELYEGAVQA